MDNFDLKKYWNEDVFEKQHFHPTAGVPWEINHHEKYLDEFWDDWRDKTVTTSSLSVLEMGCGTGNDAIWFAKKGFNVTAIDVSEKEISLAKEKSKGISNINYIIDDVHSFSTEEKFDVIYDRGCIHNNQAVDGDKSLWLLFSKLHQMLKDDGKIIILTGNPNNVCTSFSLPPNSVYIQTIEINSKDFFKIKLVKEIIFELNEGYEDSLGWLFILEKK